MQTNICLPTPSPRNTLERKPWGSPSARLHSTPPVLQNRNRSQNHHLGNLWVSSTSTFSCCCGCKFTQLHQSKDPWSTCGDQHYRFVGCRGDGRFEMWSQKLAWKHFSKFISTLWNYTDLPNLNHGHKKLCGTTNISCEAARKKNSFQNHQCDLEDISGSALLEGFWNTYLSWVNLFCWKFIMERGNQSIQNI